MIEVRLFANLRDGREKILFLDAKENLLAKDVLHRLNIMVEDVAILLINGWHSKPEDSIKDGDILAIFPPVGGG